MPDRDRFLLRKRIFHRICAAEGVDPEKVKAAVNAEHNRNTWTRLYHEGKPQLAHVFGTIGEELNREASCFMDIEPVEVIHGSPAERFARRVEELIYERRISRTYVEPQGDGEEKKRVPRPVDVVHYVWQLGDKVLANMRITFNEQLDAFELLKQWDLVEELQIGNNYGQPGQIGIMRVVLPEKDSLLQTISDRMLIEQNEIDYLEKHRKEHLRKVQFRFAERAEKYCALAPEKPPAGLFTADENDAIEIDLHCRRALVVIGSADAHLDAAYRPTRFAIGTFKRRLGEDQQSYSEWWKKQYYDNRSELEDIGKALGRPGEAASFDTLRDLLKANCDRNKEMITEIAEKYPDEFPTGSGGRLRRPLMSSSPRGYVTTDSSRMGSPFRQAARSRRRRRTGA